MDTSSYLARLEYLLDGLPIPERQYAIAYYTEYLMDAGPEGAEAAMAALGTPEVLAAQIKADIAMRGLMGSSIPETNRTHTGAPNTSGAAAGVDDWRQAGTYRTPPPNNTSGRDNRGGSSSYTYANGGSGWSSDNGGRGSSNSGRGVNGSSNGSSWGNRTSSNAGGSGSQENAWREGPGTPYSQPRWSDSRENKSPLSVIAIVLIAIFALPIGVPLAAAILGLVIALFATVGSLVVAAVATGVALTVASIVAIVIGFISLFSHWATGLFYIGVGLTVLSLTLLFDLAMFYLLRWTFKGIAMMFNVIRKRLSKQPEAV